MNSSAPFLPHLEVNNETQFRALFDRHKFELYRFVFRIVQDDAEAKDVIAESFLNLWKSNVTLNKESDVRPYLFASARNTALKLLRSKKRYHAHIQHAAYLTEDYEEPINDLSIYDELLQSVHELISRLPKKQREVMEYMLFGGLSDHEIAALLGKKLNSVQQLKYKGLEFLRGALLRPGMVTTISILLGFFFT